MELRSSRKDILVTLPSELRLEILKYLGISELLSSRLVCKTWNEILSSYKQLWIKLCTLNGIVYTEREIIKNPQKYRIFFLRMKSRVNDMKLGNCFSLETVPPHLENEYFRFVMQAFHCHEFQIGVATSEGLIYIFDLNRRPTRILQIKLNVTSLRFRILNLRLDDTNVVVLEANGSISMWDANNGRFVAKHRITEEVFCIDLLKGTLIVACGLRGCVKIIDLIRSEDIVADVTEGEAPLQVALARHWVENQESQPRIFLLFCMNNFVVSVHEIRNFPSAEKSGVKLATLLHKITLKFNPLYLQSVRPYVPSFCYDNTKYLYFPHKFNEQESTVISQFNVSTGERKEIFIDFPLHQILGAGKMTLALTSTNNSDDASLHAIDLRTAERRFTCLLTSEIGMENGCYYESGRFQRMGGIMACICETSWLNGLNGFNDVGFFSVYRDTYRLLRVVQCRQGSANR